MLLVSRSKAPTIIGRSVSGAVVLMIDSPASGVKLFLIGRFELRRRSSDGLVMRQLSWREHMNPTVRWWWWWWTVVHRPIFRAAGCTHRKQWVGGGATFPLCPALECGASIFAWKEVLRPETATEGATRPFWKTSFSCFQASNMSSNSDSLPD